MWGSPVSGSFVMTTGKVIVRPPSFGQHFRIGRRFRSTEDSSTSWHGPERTRFGARERRVWSMSIVPPRSRIAPSTPAGGRRWTRRSIRLATSLDVLRPEGERDPSGERRAGS